MGLNQLSDSDELISSPALTVTFLGLNEGRVSRGVIPRLAEAFPPADSGLKGPDYLEKLRTD